MASVYVQVKWQKETLNDVPVDVTQPVCFNVARPALRVRAAPQIHAHRRARPHNLCAHTHPPARFQVSTFKKTLFDLTGVPPERQKIMGMQRMRV